MESKWTFGIIVTLLVFLGSLTVVSAVDNSSVIDLSTASQTDVLKVYGGENNEYTGFSVISGDIDGDGLKDLIFGSLYASPNNREKAGSVTIIFGSGNLKGSSPLDLRGTLPNLLEIQGDESLACLGQSVSVGDMNGDGIDDLIMGASNASPEGRYKAGSVFILFGSPNLKSSETIDLAQPRNDILRVNGRAKVIIDYNNPGHVYYGEGGELGISVAGGDINKDGFDDAILGAWKDEVKGHILGRAYVIFGSADINSRGLIDLQTSPQGVIAISGEHEGDNFGMGTAIGDLNSDGYGDLLVDAWMADSENGTDSGVAYVIFGSSDIASSGEINLLNSQAQVVRIKGANANDYGGVLASGDVNGDMVDDLIIDAFGGDTPGGENAGKTWVVFGSKGMESSGDIDLKNDIRRVLCILGEAAEDHLGKPSVGDINGDGIGDIITQSNSADVNGKGDAGKAYIIFGSSSLSETGEIDLRESSPRVIKIFGDDAGGNLGFRSAAGDIEGDGYADIILGAHGSSPLGREWAGDVYVIWGKDQFGGSSTGQGHFIPTINTGNNATVLLQSQFPPVIENDPIMIGDEIGIFTSDGICAGAGRWTGKNLAITVWGDNTSKDGKDGFLSGETYTFRIWDASSDKVYNSTARYSQGSGEYLIDGISIVSALEVKVVEFTINLSSGWNLISSNIITSNTSMTFLLTDIAENLVLLKNGRGEIYWPQYSISQVKDWKITDGYQVYMNSASQLRFHGHEAFSQDVIYNLARNWSLISFVGPEGMSPLDAFSSLGNKLIMIKDGEGNVFWPQYEIDNLRELHHGMGYWIFLTDPASFVFPNNKSGSAKGAAQKEIGSWFKPVSGTDNNAILLLSSKSAMNLNGRPLVTGDEVGVFSPSGLCVGAGQWIEGKNLSVTIWGDNKMTSMVDGILPGEKYSLKLWDTETREEFAADVSFSQGDAEYSVNGVVIIETLKAGRSTKVNEKPLRFSISQNVPNPFNPSTTISFSLAKYGLVNLTIYDALGHKVLTLVNGIFSPGIHTVVWDASRYATGIYFYTIRAGAFIETRKMVLTK
jgi:hypothetical protein